MKDKYHPILIVEDEPDHSRLIIKSLLESGYLKNKLFLCENGQDALDFLFKKNTGGYTYHNIY